MPRRARPQITSRSEYWLRKLVNENTEFINKKIIEAVSWVNTEKILWHSRIKSDQCAEYYDEAFLKRLGIEKLKTPLKDFWPQSGPRWDGLASTESRKYLLIEAKAYIEESVDYKSKASPKSLEKILHSLQRSKKAFSASAEAQWASPFYQYANRLAHLYYLNELNNKDAYLIFIYFANAPDVPTPCSFSEWRGAIRLIKKCLGLGKHPYHHRITDIIIDVNELN